MEESALFKDVAPSGLTMIQWMAPHPEVYRLYKLDSMGKEVEEVGVDLGEVGVDLE